MIITIDGPTASGKSTIARQIAHALGYMYINSGMFYRVIAYALMKDYHYTVDQLASDVALNDARSCIAECHYEWDNGTGERMIYRNQDLTQVIKHGDIDLPASLVGLNKDIRLLILAWIREIASKKDIVIDGRDTGTVVFAHAQCKIYLTAALEVRAVRWMEDQKKRGKHYTLQQARDLLSQRDERDTHRPIAPLSVPLDACIIDSSDMEIRQVVEAILEVIKNH